MYFVKIKNRNIYEYFDFIYNLFKKNEDKLTDDLSEEITKKSLIVTILECEDHFYCIFDDKKKPCGVIFFHNWITGNGINFSCEICGISERKNKIASESLIFLSCFYLAYFNLTKIQCIINEDNKPARLCVKKAGFNNECSLIKSTIKNNKMINQEVFSLYNKKDDEK